ncbi:MAG: class I SAM-dependent methyltransferase [Flavobacteriales bacterium]|nr:class I SAM-dependent methyltransferase [Flavobacteriales bacterium]
MQFFKVKSVSIEFKTKPDLFSPKDLDVGTELLISCLPKFQYSSALDWGCGWGALGLWLAKNNPKAKIVALDSDIAAVKATQQNAVVNAITNLRVFASHSYDDVPESYKFDLIVANPPTHRGREVVESMIAQSKERLDEGGAILLVVEARIKPWVARQLKITFGDYRIVKRSRKHVVVMAEK